MLAFFGLDPIHWIVIVMLGVGGVLLVVVLTRKSGGDKKKGD
jgi:hypothetical protein